MRQNISIVILIALSLFLQQVLAEKQVKAYCTSYGFNDNDPPSAEIAYGKKDGYPTIHDKATEGSGTYDDPITFATDKNEVPIGTRIYVPYLRKYFIMEDDCAECDDDWKDKKKFHFDLWMGPQKKSTHALIDCEDYITENSQTVIIDPKDSYPVNTQRLFDPDTQKCTAKKFKNSENVKIKLENSHEVQEKKVNAYCTSYAYNDNDPPSADIAYGKKDGYPTIHDEATEGTGTYDDPITFATNKNEVPIGTRIYVPYLRKYFIMEDDCAECDDDWKEKQKYHFDLWMGPQQKSTKAIIACEDYITENSQTVIINPKDSYPVNTQKLFDPDTQKCTAKKFKKEDKKSRHHKFLNKN